VNLATAQRYAEQIVPWLAPYCDRIEVVGSIRRRRPVCNDVDLVVVPKLTTETRQVDMFTTENVVTSNLLQFLIAYVNGGNGQWLGREETAQIVPIRKDPKPDARNLLLTLRSGVQLDIFCATDSTWATLKLCRTGSKEHNIWLAHRAIDHGGHWNPYKGLTLADGLVHAICEEDIYTALKLPFIAPEQRELHLLRNL
jgi:DNA polymerase/3'-5' exonuclease PolX